MPTYTVTDPTSGRTVKLTGDSPPTEQELEQIFATIPAPTQQKQDWLTGNATSPVGKAWNAGMNILNIPSYVAGGAMRNLNQEDTNLVNAVPRIIQGNIKGLQEKTPVMQELPPLVGVDPNTLPGMAIGLAGEVAMPDPVDAYHLLTKSPKLAEKAVKYGGKAYKEAAEGSVTKGLNDPALQRKINDLGKPLKENIQEFMLRRNLLSRNPQEAEDLLGVLGKEFDELAVKSGKEVKFDDVLNAYKKALDEQNQLAAAGSEAAKATFQELLKRRNFFLEKTSKIGKVNKAGEFVVDIGDITKLKQAVTKDIPANKIGLGLQDLNKSGAADKARKIYQEAAIKAEPALRGLGLDMARAKEVKKLFERAASRGQSNKLFSLGKAATTMAGGTIAGVPGAVAGYAAESLARSPKALSFFARSGKPISELAGRLAPYAGKVQKVGEDLLRIFNQPRNQNQPQSQMLLPTANASTDTLSTGQQPIVKPSVSPSLPGSIPQPYRLKNKIKNTYAL